MFDINDERIDFLRQTTLFGVLVKGTYSKDKLLSVTFLELAKDFLGFKYHHTKAGRNNSIYWYDFVLPDVSSIQMLRQTIWEATNNCFVDFPTQSLDLLDNYLDHHGYDIVKGIAQHDVNFILKIIDNHFVYDSFLNCRYVQELVRWCRRHDIQNLLLKKNSQKYRNSIYEMYIKIDLDRYRDKDIYQFDNYEQYERLKEAEIRNCFIFESIEEIKSFYREFTYLKQLTMNDRNYALVLDYIIDENYLRNFHLGEEFLKLIIETENTISYIPRLVFRNQLKDTKRASVIKKIMQQHHFNLKIYWTLAFFEFIDITKENIDELLKSIGGTEESFNLSFNRFDRYLPLKPDLFQEILKISTEKNAKKGAQIQILRNIYSDNFSLLGDDIDLIKKSYTQQYFIQKHFDFSGAGFLEILKKDPRFLVEFIKTLYENSNNNYLSYDHREYGFVWEVDGIQNEIAEVIDVIAENESNYFGILNNYCNIFFSKIKEEHESKVEEFLLDFVKKHYNHTLKMNIITEIGRKSFQHIFEGIILTYISFSQDPNHFIKIMWMGNGGAYSGDEVIGDIQAGEWRNILTIVSKSNLGFKLIPLKKAINDQIESYLKLGDLERERRFIGGD